MFLSASYLVGPKHKYIKLKSIEVPQDHSSLSNKRKGTRNYHTTPIQLEYISSTSLNRKVCPRYFHEVKDV